MEQSFTRILSMSLTAGLVLMSRQGGATLSLAPGPMGSGPFPTSNCGLTVSANIFAPNSTAECSIQVYNCYSLNANSEGEGATIVQFVAPPTQNTLTAEEISAACSGLNPSALLLFSSAAGGSPPANQGIAPGPYLGGDGQIHPSTPGLPAGSPINNIYSLSRFCTGWNSEAGAQYYGYNEGYGWGCVPSGSYTCNAQLNDCNGTSCSIDNAGGPECVQIAQIFYGAYRSAIVQGTGMTEIWGQGVQADLDYSDSLEVLDEVHINWPDVPAVPSQPSL